jgi:hypothetical protein
LPGNVLRAYDCMRENRCLSYGHLSGQFENLQLKSLCSLLTYFWFIRCGV